MSREPDPAHNPLLADLQALQAYAAQFQDVIASAQQAAPVRGSGRDGTGTVMAEIDGQGTPTSLTIAAGWRHRLGAAELAAAVTEAYQAAVQEHLEQWGEDLQRQGWQYDVREFDEKVASTPPSDAPRFPAPTAFGAPRGIDSLLGDLIGELDFAHDLVRQPPAAPTPAAPPTARVSVTLQGAQLSSVHIDPEWAEGKEAAVINAELSAALQTARLEQPPATTRLPHADRLDDLLGEVMNFMSQHRSEK